ncbi:uncharacterized protein LOC142238532 [Haematobia irritans]|uniref:uncharacterized protein LOC142238532 n=1 Tax=Haematobia irritans TaxID=7368 RepID=UPI003F50571A
MLIMLRLCNFGTIYLWIFALKVLSVWAADSAIEDNEDARGNGGEGGGVGIEVSPMLNALNGFPHSVDDLLHERGDDAKGKLWPIPVKYKQHPLFYDCLTFTPVASQTGSTGENSKFTKDSYPITNGIKEFCLQQMVKWLAYKNPEMTNKLNEAPLQQPHRFPLLSLLSSPVNILYKTTTLDNERSLKQLENEKTKNQRISEWLNELRRIANSGNNGDDNANYQGTMQERFNYPIDGLGFAHVNDQSGVPNLNDFNELIGKLKFIKDRNKGTLGDVESVVGSQAQTKRSRSSRDKKPKPETITPYLPAISAGSMVNLGKFFRDLSKNVQFNEKHQWTAEDQKLLEGDPHYGNLQHHFSDPEVTSDRTGEWIKAIRFYRPSQKIRSLVEMNPHGQWAHGSNFIDPNYMWMGLGK